MSYYLIDNILFYESQAGPYSLILVIIAAQEAEIRRIAIHS
jgi:hypothetical protein